MWVTPSPKIAWRFLQCSFFIVCRSKRHTVIREGCLCAKAENLLLNKTENPLPNFLFHSLWYPPHTPLIMRGHRDEINPWRCSSTHHVLVPTSIDVPASPSTNVLVTVMERLFFVYLYLMCFVYHYGRDWDQFSWFLVLLEAPIIQNHSAAFSPSHVRSSGCWR